MSPETNIALGVIMQLILVVMICILIAEEVMIVILRLLVTTMTASAGLQTRFVIVAWLANVKIIEME